jgi:transposase
VVTIGLDIAKNVFQVHGVDAAGRAVLRRKLTRGEVLRFFEAQPKALVGMEACGTGHFWAREISALGHEVKLLPPSDVKPYVKRGKTDAADAEAICEAVTRPNMRFVPIKTPEQQAALMMLYRTRFFGHAVALCGAPEVGVEMRRTGVERAAETVLLDQPFGVVAGEEVADGLAELVDGLEDAAMDDLLVECR